MTLSVVDCRLIATTLARQAEHQSTALSSLEAIRYWARTFTDLADDATAHQWTYCIDVAPAMRETLDEQQARWRQRAPDLWERYATLLTALDALAALMRDAHSNWAERLSDELARHREP